jgi:hypothetical protein
MLGTAVTLFLASVLAPLTASAECGGPSVAFAMTDKSVELVFSGRVVEITQTAELGYRYTFDVYRVWKGSVPKRFALHVWELAPEMPRYEKNGLYVGLAKRLTDRLWRKGAGLPDDDTVAFTSIICGGALATDFERQLLEAWGPGYPPSSKVAPKGAEEIRRDAQRSIRPAGRPRHHSGGVPKGICSLP